MDKKQLALDSIRSTLESFGHDVDNITNEELENGIYVLGKVIANSGITIGEAMQSLSLKIK